MLSLTLKTSNSGKMQEMLMAGIPNLSIEAGEDLPEIQSDDFILVAAYKSQAAGEMVIIEDSILSIQDKFGVFQPVVDAKFKMKEIKSNIRAYSGKNAKYISTVAVQIDNKIYVQTASLDCIIGKPYTGDVNAMGFDDVLHVIFDEEYKSIHYLKTVEQVNPSPRIKSLKKLFAFLSEKESQNKGLFIYEKPLPKWNGDYQS